MSSTPPLGTGVLSPRMALIDVPLCPEPWSVLEAGFDAALTDSYPDAGATRAAVTASVARAEIVMWVMRFMVVPLVLDRPVRSIAGALSATAVNDRVAR